MSEQEQENEGTETTPGGEPVVNPPADEDDAQAQLDQLDTSSATTGQDQPVAGEPGYQGGATGDFKAGQQEPTPEPETDSL